MPLALADAVSRLARSPSRCHVTLLDIELGLTAAPEFFSNDEETDSIGLMFLAERFQMLLEAEDDARLRRFFD